MSVRACAVGVAHAARQAHYGRQQPQPARPAESMFDPGRAQQVVAAAASALAALTTARRTALAEDTTPKITGKGFFEHDLRRLEQVGQTLIAAGSTEGLTIVRATKDAGEELIRTLGGELNKPLNEMDRISYDLLMQFHATIERTLSALDKPGALTGELPDAISEVRGAIPLLSKNSFVRSVEPIGFVGDDSSTVFKVRGSFPHIAQGQKAVVRIGDKVVKPVLATTHELQFVVEAKDFPPTDKAALLEASLVFSNPEKWWLNPTRLFDPAESTYNIALRILPKSPGSIRVESTAARTYTETIPRSANLSQWANSFKHHVIRPTPGWKIVPGSSQVIKVHGCMPFEPGLPIREAPNLVYKIETGKHRRCKSARFLIKYDEEKECTETRSTKKDRDLKWGESIVYDLPEGASFKVIYTTFNGTRIEMMGTDHTNQYVWVSRRGDQLKITVKDPFTSRRR
ncbi:MAG: hypothetical protein P0S96_07355 [Simkaniaceae bacterium]|nr:hypothetical protein [Candidatus Sacchlamyda saccharinae]